MKNVLLIGINGVYNFGCEAIIRGTVEILRNTHQEINISYGSFNYEYDKKRLTDCPITVIDRSASKDISIRRIFRRLCSYINVDIVLPYDDISFVKENNFDTIFSIGGDIYTLNSQGSFNKSLPIFCEACQKLGVKYVLFGASVGPFDKNPAAEIFFKEHLKKANLIVAREKVTVNYLKKIGVSNNVKLAPDPAFFVASEIVRNDVDFQRDDTLAINLSPLSSLYFYPNLSTAIDIMTASIVNLLEKSSFKIKLIPHVLSQKENDDDLGFLRKIYDKIPVDLVKRVSILNSDVGFIGTKKELIKCNYVIAVRMHCAVNSVCSNVPTVFVAYSEKAKGMVEMVYGGSENLIGLKEIENTDLILRLLKENQFKFNIKNLQDFDFRFLNLI